MSHVDRESPTPSGSAQDGASHRRPVGLIGIGLLGTALAERLLHAGFKVVGFDLDPTRGRALRDLGGSAAASPAEVARACERVLLCLPDSSVVALVIGQMTSLLTARHLIVDTTTGRPEDAVVAARRLARGGAAYLEATISGSSQQVRAGEATVMAGGRADDLSRARELIACFARQLIHVGPVGAGARMKLTTNLVLGLNRAALAEGLAFARRAGLDPAVTLEALRSGMAYSRIMDTKAGKMIAGDFTPQARLSQHLKDVRLMLEEADRMQLELPLTEAHRGLLERAEEAGLGELDNSAILRVIEGVPERRKKPA